jgi:uncharacterized membrane protein
MFEKTVLYLITEHRGKMIGILLGLLASILFISYGFWRSLFVVFCILMGYVIGKKIDDHANLEVWIKNLFKEKS